MSVIRDYQFNSGEDYNGLADSDAAIPGMPSQTLPTGFDMSAASMPVGINAHDAMEGLDSNGMPFGDNQDNRQFTHPDTMSGLAGQGTEAQVIGADMYHSQPQVPVYSESPEAHDMLEGGTE